MRADKYDKLENSRVLIQKDVSETTAKVNEIYQIIKNDQVEHILNFVKLGIKLKPFEIKASLPASRSSLAPAGGFANSCPKEAKR